MACEIHLNDAGTIFSITMKDCTDVIDVSGAITKQLVFKKPAPDNTVIPKTAYFINTGVDGKIAYKTLDTDLDKAGTWELQAVVQLSTGKWSSDIVTFKVHENL